MILIENIHINNILTIYNESSLREVIIEKCFHSSISSRLIIKLARNGAVNIDSDVVNGMIGICLSNASLLFLSKICAPSINAKSCMIVVRFVVVVVEIFSRLSSLFIVMACSTGTHFYICERKKKFQKKISCFQM